MAIARALVFEPEVLLLDEPLSNLDARLRAQMGEEFRALQRRLKITTVYVTHDQEEAMALSDRVVVMQKGRILQIGAPETVYRQPASRDVAAFFGTPNLIEAKVTACRPAGSGFVLSVEGGECRAAQPFKPGETVLLMVRPEDVTLSYCYLAKEEIVTQPMGDQADVRKRVDRKSTRLNSSHSGESRMPSSA